MKRFKYYMPENSKAPVDYDKREIMKYYQDAINKIDDYFEYSNQSISDREFIHKTMDTLTANIAAHKEFWEGRKK